MGEKVKKTKHRKTKCEKDLRPSRGRVQLFDPEPWALQRQRQAVRAAFEYAGEFWRVDCSMQMPNTFQWLRIAQRSDPSRAEALTKRLAADAPALLVRLVHVCDRSPLKIAGRAECFLNHSASLSFQPKCLVPFSCCRLPNN